MGDKNKSRSKGRKRKGRVAKRQSQKDDGPNPKRLATEDRQETADTASARKLSVIEQENQDTDDRSSVEGFILMDISILFGFVGQFMGCPECSSSTVVCHLDLGSKSGFAHNIVLSCESCPWTATMETSKKIPDSKCGQNAREVNTRMVTFARSLGRGHSALQNFSLFMNSPAPMSRKNYRKNFQKVHVASKEVARQSMAKAASELRESQAFVSSVEINGGCAVSLDGTWQKRGYASHHGIVTCISVQTGKCLDAEVLSNICQGCAVWEKKNKDSTEYAQWKIKHVCKINHQGSAAAMEPVGAVRIFSRSEQVHNIKYTQYLGDGDSASFKKVLESKPYDTTIEKLECVGHVQKRVGSRLRRMKTTNKGLKLSDGKGLRGRLTDKTIDTLQNYFGMAIRQNSGNLADMRASVKAVLPHVASSSAKPMHKNCPDGVDSWCGFKRNPDSYKHRKGIPQPIVDFIQPVFDDLSSEVLLKKCLHGKTQNVNECLNKLIWDRCSKEYFVERSVIEEATYSAISHFNDGRLSILHLLHALGITTAGRFSEEHCMRQNTIRLGSSARKSSEKAKKQRKHLRARRKGFQDKLEQSEGNLYGAGAH